MVQKGLEGKSEKYAKIKDKKKQKEMHGGGKADKMERYGRCVDDEKK